MATYRNTKTGVIVRVRSEVRGDWELVPDSPESLPVADIETEPKKEPAKPKRKRTAKKK